jgi:hypothetical protein
MLVSDPFYDHPHDKEFLLLLENMKLGDWKVFVSRYRINNDHDINVSLTALHVENALSDTSSLKWLENEKLVHSESGKIGFFDAVRFKGGSDDLWYEKSLSLVDESFEAASVMPGGAISASGLGKGKYSVSICTDSEKQIVCVKVVFFDNPNATVSEPLTREERLSIAHDLLKRTPWSAALRFRELHEYSLAAKAVTKTINKADNDDPLLINYYIFRAAIYDKMNKTDLAIEDRRTLQRLRE